MNMFSEKHIWLIGWLCKPSDAERLGNGNEWQKSVVYNEMPTDFAVIPFIPHFFLRWSALKTLKVLKDRNKALNCFGVWKR